MFWLLMSLIFILSAVLIIAILMQSSKGSGLAGTFGGSNIGAVFGTRRTADFLAKATWWIAGIIVVLILLTNLFFLPGKTTAADDEGARPQQQQQQQPRK